PHRRLSWRTMSGKIYLCGQPFYTRFRLEKQWVCAASRHTLFWTPLMGPVSHGLHRTHCLPAFQSHIERAGTLDALRADRGGTGFCRDACADRRTAIDIADAAQMSSVPGLSPHLRDNSPLHSAVSMSTTLPAS